MTGVEIQIFYKSTINKNFICESKRAQLTWAQNFEEFFYANLF